MKHHRAALWLLIVLAAAHAAGVLDAANELYAAGEYRRAIASYRKALDQGANPALAYFNLGNSYYQLDSTAAAIVCYETAVREAPEFDRALLNLGILYYGMDALGEAVAVLERARGLDDSDPQILLTLGSAYTKLRYYRRAVPLLEQVLALDSSRTECCFVLFDINRALGDFDEARRWLERYPDSGARVADKYQLLGELAEEQLGSREAVYYYQRLVDLAPDRRSAHTRLVKALFDNGNALSAVQQARHSLRTFDDFADLALMAGNRAFEAGLSSAAEELYTRAYRLGRAGGLVGLRNLRQRYAMQGNETAAGRIDRLLLGTPR
ncbi:MAG: tetratricopeptide repeat protein [Chitinivibrionales bacterium]|nr:tetratricopeptide repeat protein [Chitinivibrionales bacterium]